jgi:hypothetical protein
VLPSIGDSAPVCTASQPEDVSTSSEVYYLWTIKNKQTEQIWYIDVTQRDVNKIVDSDIIIYNL